MEIYMLAAYNPRIIGQYNSLLYRTTKQDFDHKDNIWLQGDARGAVAFETLTSNSASFFFRYKKWKKSPHLDVPGSQ